MVNLQVCQKLASTINSTYHRMDHISVRGSALSIVGECLLLHPPPNSLYGITAHLKELPFLFIRVYYVCFFRTLIYFLSPTLLGSDPLLSFSQLCHPNHRLVNLNIEHVEAHSSRRNSRKTLDYGLPFAIKKLSTTSTAHDVCRSYKLVSSVSFLKIHQQIKMRLRGVQVSSCNLVSMTRSTSGSIGIGLARGAVRMELRLERRICSNRTTVQCSSDDRMGQELGAACTQRARAVFLCVCVW